MNGRMADESYIKKDLEGSGCGVYSLRVVENYKKLQSA
jgi:hypothetical protein